MKRIIINKQSGIIKTIILLIIAIGLVSWYREEIKNFFISEEVQTNLGYIQAYLTNFWNEYLAEPVGRLWEMWLNYVWNPIINFIKK